MNEAIRKLKRNCWEEFSADMEHHLYGAQKRVWNMLRNRKKHVNEFVQTTRITPEEWEKYFADLYKEEDTKEETDNAYVEEPGASQYYTITTEEIQRTLSKLKNRKTPRVDGITNELIKYGGSLLTELSMLFNKILCAKRIPIQWKESITIPIFKKGTKLDTKNCRGISLLSTVQKLLTKILAREIARKQE